MSLAHQVHQQKSESMKRTTARVTCVSSMNLMALLLWLKDVDNALCK